MHSASFKQKHTQKIVQNWRSTRLRIISFLSAYLCLIAAASAQQADRVILFMIDGLHWQAPQRLNMPNLSSLIAEGSYVAKSYMIIPHHPSSQDYIDQHNSSLPNPVLHSGTVFQTPATRMLQEMLPKGQHSAFLVNSTTAYKSVSRGFSTVVMDSSLTDRELLEQSLHIIETQNPRLMRINLQTSSNQGLAVSRAAKDKPYHQNIYGEGSPYVTAVEHADALLGQLTTHLKKSGMWSESVIIVTSDHGQSLVGWHAMLDPDSWVTPLVFAGQNIAKGRRIKYFEHTDLAPTIAWMLGLQPPSADGGAGKLNTSMMSNAAIQQYDAPQYIKTINQQIRDYNVLKSRMTLAAEKNQYYANVLAILEDESLAITAEPFYHQDRVMQWHEAGTTENMIAANQHVLNTMRLELKQHLSFWHKLLNL